MGLLDEAIREHLELKRRRGADPAEVTREQHEALDSPSTGTRSAELGAGAEGDEGVAPEDGDARSGSLEHGLGLDDRVAVEQVGGEAPPTQAAESSPSVEEPGSFEETAELDMKTVLEDEELPAAESGVAHDAADLTAPLPGQEHLQFEHDPAVDSGQEN